MQRSLPRTLLALFLTLLFSANAQQGPYVLTKYVDIVDDVEFGIMTMAEYQERHKIVRQEMHVFDLALRAAVTQWEGEKALAFPRIFSKPELTRLRVYTKQADAAKKIREMQQAENERVAIRERNEKNSNVKTKGGSRRGKGGNKQSRSNKTDMEKLYRQQREARNSAKSIVRDKMDEMMGTLNSAHTGRMRPEDVLSAGRPK